MRIFEAVRGPSACPPTPRTDGGHTRPQCGCSLREPVQWGWLSSRAEGLIPAALVVGIIVVHRPALAVETHRAPLFAHIDLELAPGSAPLPAVVLVAETIPGFAHRK